MKAGIRAVCRPPARQADEIIRLKRRASGPSEIAVKLGIGRASVYRVLGSRSGVDRVAA